MLQRPKSFPTDLSRPIGTDAERRSGFRGSAQFDLCNLLEAARVREQLETVALSDQAGIVLAGAGRYQDCEELSARAANDSELVQAELEVYGARLLLSAVSREKSRPLDPVAASELSSACVRILSRQTKALSALLGT